MATNINLPTINIGGTSTTGAGDPTRPFYSPDVITPEQYFAGPVDFYRQTLGTGISVTDPTEEEEQREDTSPNIFEPIGGGGDDYQSALSYTLSSTGQSGQMPSYDVTNYGVADVNSDVINSISGGKDLSKSWEQGFFDKLGDMVSVAGNVFEQQANKLKDASLTDILSGVSTTGPFGTRPRSTMVPGAVAAMPGVSSFAGLAAGFGALNMAQQAQNAAAFKATSAGALMDVNGMMVSRAPGSLNYVGNLGNYSSKQIAGLEAISKGFVPGTLKAEVYDQTKKAWSYATGTKSMLDSDTMKSIGGTYDPTTGKFVNAFGQTSAMGTEKAAKATVGAFNSKYGSELGWGTVSQIRSQVQTDFFGNVKPGTPTFQDLLTEAAIKDSMQRTGLTRTQLDKVKAGDFIVRSGSYDPQGRFTPGTSVGTNTKGYSTFSDFRGSSEEEDDAPDTGPTAGTPSATTPSTPSAPVDDYDSSFGWDNNSASDNTNDSPSDSSSNSDVSSDQQADEDAGVDWAAGGRIGYAPGGEAGFAQRPEFVGGNQTQPDGVSVADDQPRDVQEGTFVINAAAADFAGRDDIEKMIRDAYKKVGDTGQSGVTQEVAINVSKGEVMIPPHIAKVIGYDRLNKINNRGKKEIARRQEVAGGGFIDRKKFAAGDVVLPKSKPKRVNQAALGDVELRADMEEFIQTDPLARLGWNLYEKGDLDIKAIVLPSKKEVQVNVAGVYTPRSERRDPGRVSRQFEGFAEKQGITKQNRKVAGVHYITGENVNYGRSDATLTLLHELRHHAMRHLNKKYKIPLPELSREEAIFDAQDHANRIQARKVKPSIPREAKEKNLEITQRHMYMSPSANKEMAMYQSVAEEVLKDRKVPPRTKSKEVEGFFTRAMRLLGL